MIAWRKHVTTMHERHLGICGFGLVPVVVRQTFQLYKAVLKRQSLEGASCHTVHTCTEAMQLEISFPLADQEIFLPRSSPIRQTAIYESKNSNGEIIVPIDDLWCP